MSEGTSKGKRPTLGFQGHDSMSRSVHLLKPMNYNFPPFNSFRYLSHFDQFPHPLPSPTRWGVVSSPSEAWGGNYCLSYHFDRSHQADWYCFCARDTVCLWFCLWSSEVLSSDLQASSVGPSHTMVRFSRRSLYHPAAF